MLSAIVIAKNEAERISACLHSLSFADELIVIDDESTDGTSEISKRLGAKVISHSLQNDFAAQRNFALSQTQADWVLFLDADEVATKKLGEEIKKIIADNDCDAYLIRRRDYFYGRLLKHGETGNKYLLRLGKRVSGRWQRPVHETWEFKSHAGRITAAIEHYPHQNINDFLVSLNHYSGLHARAHLSAGKKANILKILLFPTGKFIGNFIFKLGFLDGFPGFIIALMMSFHSFLAWGKTYLAQSKKMAVEE